MMIVLLPVNLLLKKGKLFSKVSVSRISMMKEVHCMNNNLLHFIKDAQPSKYNHYRNKPNGLCKNTPSSLINYTTSNPKTKFSLKTLNNPYKYQPSSHKNKNNSQKN